jgi:hypothetical protein
MVNHLLEKMIRPKLGPALPEQQPSDDAFTNNLTHYYEKSVLKSRFNTVEMIAFARNPYLM